MIGLLHRITVLSGDVISVLHFDTDKQCFSTAGTVKTPSQRGPFACNGNMLYSAGSGLVAIYSLTGERFVEVQSFKTSHIAPSSMELAGGFLFISGGIDGTDTVCSLSGDGLITGSTVIAHTSEKSSDAAHFASCCRMTSNPYRFANADDNLGTVCILNIYSQQGSLSVRECSRVSLNKPARIADMLFTSIDCCYLLDLVGKRIIRCDFHSGSGSLWPLESYYFDPSPTAFALSDDEKYLFTVFDDGGLKAFSLDDDGKLIPSADAKISYGAPKAVFQKNDGHIFVCTSSRVYAYFFDGVKLLPKAEFAAIEPICGACMG